jgi:transposase-like protein
VGTIVVTARPFSRNRLKGLSEIVEHIWPATTVETCAVHLLRNTFRLSTREHWDARELDLKPICTAPSGAGRIQALLLRGARSDGPEIDDRHPHPNTFPSIG